MVCPRYKVWCSIELMSTDVHARNLPGDMHQLTAQATYTPDYMPSL